MKKFAFLLAIVAVFAMSASAFAAAPTVETSPYDGGDVVNNATPTEISGAPDEPKKEANYYYLNSAYLDKKIDNVLVGFQMKNDASTAKQITATVSGDAVNDGTNDYIGAGAASNAAFNAYAVIPSKNLTFTAASEMVLTEAENSTTAKLKLNPVSVDICLSADGTAVDAINGFAGIKLEDVALSLDITEDTIKIADYNDLKLAIISTDLKTIISKDADLATAVDGLAFAVDATAKNVTIKGTPGQKALGSYILAAYVEAEPKVNSVASVAGLTKATGAGDNYILACTVITIEKTAAQKVDEAIANAPDAIKAELAKVNDGKGGPVALIMDNSGASITSVDVQAVECDYTTTGTLTLTVISLDLKGATSVDSSPTWTESTLSALAASATSDDVHSLSIPAKLADDSGSKVLLYTIDPQIFKDDNPTPVLTSEARTAAPAGFHDVEVDYTISFPKTVGVKDINVTYTTYEKDANSSSSGACDMGFGLVAVAGLAVLALRKRSK